MAKTKEALETIIPISKEERIDFEVREEGLIEDLKSSVLFCGLLEYISSGLGSEQFPRLSSLNRILVVSGFKRAAEYYGGFGILGLKGRVEVLERIQARLEPVFIKVSELGETGVAGEIFERQQRARGEWELVDVMRGDLSEFLGSALQKIPNLEARIFHAYGLARCFFLFPVGVEKVVRRTLAYEKKVQNMKEMVELYAQTRGSIPPKTLARLKDQGVIEEAEYSQYYFDSDVKGLISWYILREEWEEVRTLAEWAASTYNLLAKYVREDFDEKRFIGESALWGWIAQNLETLKKDIEFISGEREEK